MDWNPHRSLKANLQDWLSQTEPGPVLRDLVQSMLALKCPGLMVTVRETLPVYPDLLVLFDGCLEVGDTVIHVVPNVGEALVRHCAEDLANGRHPLVLTLDDAVTAARALLGYAGLAERVEVMDALDFLGAGLLTLANFRVEQWPLIAAEASSPIGTAVSL
jgi:hypothetical protein